MLKINLFGSVVRYKNYLGTFKIAITAKTVKFVKLWKEKFRSAILALLRLTFLSSFGENKSAMTVLKIKSRTNRLS